MDEHRHLADGAGANDAVQVATRRYLSSEHLWSSLHATRRCRAIETELLGKVRVDIEHRTYAMTAVLSAVAFLEALVNETYDDAHDTQHDSGRIAALDGRARGLMAAFWQATRGRDRYVGVLDKYRMALLFAGAPPFDQGANPYQDAELLIRLRNELVHFRPTWHEQGVPDKFGDKLAERFAPSGLLPANDGSPWITRALGAGGAAWAYNTCKAFADAWTDRLGIARAYEADLAAWEQGP
ncbi:hypothetical protein DQ239_11830 [Blastococcus sp. TF02-09]|uniref:hypothetical protein n=1 Tax=Blastococcus sp. TF02-09 TaxID=2250576 RepID=UPI000DE87A3F|nr:hypothetical protein [Blastococcus sp. TF02-9]RBY76881.1 hypothetical protein DQ239_11830 [Blastococcus sp. TF02-9]